DELCIAISFRSTGSSERAEAECPRNSLRARDASYPLLRARSPPARRAREPAVAEITSRSGLGDSVTVPLIPKRPRLALALALVALFVAVWTVLPPPTYALLVVAVVA